MYKKDKNHLQKINFFIYFFATAFLIILLPPRAESKNYNVEELLLIAEQNSANIKSLDSLVSAQKSFANQQKYWENPTTSFNDNFGQKNYTISQTIPFYNKLQQKYNIDNAESMVLDAKKNNLALLVKAELFALLYQYRGLQMKIDLAKARIARLSLLEKYLSNIVLNSPSKKSQAQITKDRIKLIERDLAMNQNLLYQTWNRANIFLNLDKEPSKIIIEWLGGKNYLGRQYYVNLALENNLDLREQKILIDKYKSELAYAKIEKMPDVNVSLSRQNNSVKFSGYNQNANSFGISISVPLINRNKEKIFGAESKIKSQEYAYDFQKTQLLNLINNDLNQYEVALKIAKEFPISEIDLILKRLTRANNDFKKGILDFIIYIELDLQEYQIIETIIDTQIDIANSYAKLMTKIGDFIIPASKE